jgi:CheY-like chemotaxis protein
MSAPDSKRKGVLLVDDEVPFLETVGPAFAQWSQGTWEVYLAPDVGKALGILEGTEIDLVVVDVRMPMIDGVQFLRLLNRKYPNLQKAVLTGYANDHYRAACLGEGAELFLEKPRNPKGLQSIFAALNELLKWQPEQGFRGVLRRVGLQDVLQMECLSRHSVVLEVAAGNLRGLIFVQEGQVIHAQMGEIQGEEAFYTILALRGGEFQLKPFASPPRMTIQGPWEVLLMEAARKQDEGNGHATVTHLPPTVLPSGAPASAGTLDTGHAEAFKAATPMVSTQAEKAKDDLYPTQVDEMLLASAHGDILYEWQCHDPDSRVGFLEFLTLRSRLLSHSLPLGRFDRIELLGDRTRVVAQIQADRGVMVRSSKQTLTLKKH